jgi:hypothetical protein
MNAYTVSRLALDAGVSVHIVRDYLLRGLLRPVACTPGGFVRKVSDVPVMRRPASADFLGIRQIACMTRSSLPRTVAARGSMFGLSTS